MQAHLETIVCKFGRIPAISLREEAILGPAQKCQYHVTFDLEHTQDARTPVDHRVQVWWRSSYLFRRRSDLRKKFSDRRTDRQTTDATRLH